MFSTQNLLKLCQHVKNKIFVKRPLLDIYHAQPSCLIFLFKWTNNYSHRYPHTDLCKFPKRRAQYRARSSDRLSLPVDADRTLAPVRTLTPMFNLTFCGVSEVLGGHGGFRDTFPEKDRCKMSVPLFVQVDSLPKLSLNGEMLKVRRFLASRPCSCTNNRTCSISLFLHSFTAGYRRFLYHI
jgi:hypothetical protein